MYMKWTGRTCRYWWFIAIGVLQIVTAFLLGVIYFSIRGLTTSLQHVETIPTYANAILLLCSGILVMFLYKKRMPLLLVPALVLNMVCFVLFTTCAILTGIQVAKTVHNFLSCQYRAATFRCHCFMVRQTTKTSFSTYESAAMSELLYDGAPSCAAIQSGLRDFMYTLCALYSVGDLLCFLGIFFGLIVFQNQKVAAMLEEDPDGFAYERHTNDYAGFEECVSFRYIPFPNAERPSRRRRPSLREMRRRSRSVSPKPMVSRQITLPGMGPRLLAQQLGLPGNNNNARLISVRRNDSEFNPIAPPYRRLVHSPSSTLDHAHSLQRRHSCHADANCVEGSSNPAFLDDNAHPETDLDLTITGRLAVSDMDEPRTETPTFHYGFPATEPRASNVGPRISVQRSHSSPTRTIPPSPSSSDISERISRRTSTFTTFRPDDDITPPADSNPLDNRQSGRRRMSLNNDPGVQSPEPVRRRRRQWPEQQWGRPERPWRPERLWRSGPERYWRSERRGRFSFMAPLPVHPSSSLSRAPSGHMYPLPNHVVLMHYMWAFQEAAARSAAVRRTHIAFPNPTEPPPPYRVSELPPYIEHDYAPSYHSHLSAPPSLSDISALSSDGL